MRIHEAIKNCTYNILGELVQGEATRSNHCVNWGSILLANIDSSPVSISLRYRFACMVINSTSSLVVVDMANKY